MSNENNQQQQDLLNVYYSHGIRISLLEKQLENAINDIKSVEERIEVNYATLHKRISDMRDDLQTTIETKYDKIIEKFETYADNEHNRAREIQNKIETLEKWRWMVWGGAIVVGTVVAHFLKIKGIVDL